LTPPSWIKSSTTRELLVAARPAQVEQQLNVGGLTLHPGDKVVLTGQTQRGPAEIAAQAQAAGLRMMTSVSRKTTVVVAADPDSLSGKAEDARALGIPVVNEDTFMRVLHAMS
jgi:DNA polymerase III subunit epsilon